jgi:RNA polymerase sigma-70 factor (sigma-E family)
MAREAEGFESFVVARYASMVRAAVLLGIRPADAEDAVQEALARCYAAWSRGRQAHDPDAYAYQVLVNGVRRAGRRRWTGEVPHAEPPPSAHGAGGRADAAHADPASTVPLAQSVRAALGRLSRAHRQVLVLRYFADLTEAQTARVLGVAPGTVKSRTSRAVSLLARDPDLATESPSPTKEGR